MTDNVLDHWLVLGLKLAYMHVHVPSTAQALVPGPAPLALLVKLMM